MDDPQWPRASGWLAGGGATDPRAPLLAVLGLPLSQASISPSQAHTTPPAVRRALSRFSTLAAFDTGVTVNLASVRVADLGDVGLEGIVNDDAQMLIAGAVAEVFGSPVLERAPDLLVLIGGDNAVTRPAMSAAVADLSTAGLLTLDAHHDVRGWHAGRTNGTPVRGLIEDGLPGANIVQIGLGTFTNAPAYRQYSDEQGITVITVSEARRRGVATCVREELDRLAQRCEQIYVDLDVDVLDAAFVPGCPGARPGGLAPWELHEAAVAAGRHRAVMAIDIVEVDAQADRGGLTVDTAALCLLSAAAGLAQRPE
jgi:formiminoglutamase